MKFGINFFPSFRPEDSTTADYYEQCLRLAARADELGYHSIKTVEHSFYDYGGHSPNPCVFLSAVAARTKRVRLITGAVIPAFHHPAHLGGDLAMLDNMSRGRLGAGFGRAFLPKEFEVYGVPMSESRERFEEAIGMIRRLWTEERVSAKGKYWAPQEGGGRQRERQVRAAGGREAHAARGAEAASAGVDRRDLDGGVVRLCREER